MSGAAFGAVALAGMAAATLASARPARALTSLTLNDIPGTGNIKILNFALALEDLETELYVQALQRLTGGGNGGRDVSASVGAITGLGLSTGNRAVSFTNAFTAVERSHRDYLRAKISQLGGTPINPFKYNFGIQTMSAQQVCDLIFLAEQTGVGAYLGAISLLDRNASTTPAVFQIAASIQGTEARHTAIFADILNDQFGEAKDVAPLPAPPFTNQAPFDNAQPNGKAIDKPVPPNTVLNNVKGFILTT